MMVKARLVHRAGNMQDIIQVQYIEDCVALCRCSFEYFITLLVFQCIWFLYCDCIKANDACENYEHVFSHICIVTVLRTQSH